MSLTKYKTSTPWTAFGFVQNYEVSFEYSISRKILNSSGSIPCPIQIIKKVDHDCSWSTCLCYISLNNVSCPAYGIIREQRSLLYKNSSKTLIKDYRLKTKITFHWSKTVDLELKSMFENQDHFHPSKTVNLELKSHLVRPKLFYFKFIRNIGENFVKATCLLKKLLKSWIHKIFSTLCESEFCVLPLCFEVNHNLEPKITFYLLIRNSNSAVLDKMKCDLRFRT